MGTEEPRPVGSYEWVQILRRARCDSLIPAKGKRGAVSGLAFKGVALVLAAHGNGVTGADVFPADGTVAVLAETSIRTVKLVKAKLVELGLLTRVRVGGRRPGDTDGYQLTLPCDLLDVLEVLTPAQVQARGRALADSFRGRGGSTKPPTESADESTVEGPVDPPRPLDNPPVGDPVDPPHEDPPDVRGGSSGQYGEARGGSTGPYVGGPPVPPTNQDQPPNLTNHPDGDLRTDLTLVRATGSVEDPDSAMGGGFGWGVPPPPAVAERARRGAQMVRLSIAKRDDADAGPSLRLVEAAS